MGGCSGSLCMGKPLCSFQPGNVVVLLFYREQGYGCAERARVVQQGREEDLWQEGNCASLTGRESIQVTVTRSLSNPSFPGSLCSFHAGSTFPACTASGAAGRPGQPQEQRATADSILLLALECFTGSLEAQVGQTRGTTPCQQQQQHSQSSSSSAGQEQRCFYGAVVSWFQDAPECSATPVCTHSQGFHITESDCCTVCSPSSIQDGLKIGSVLL